MFCEVATVGIKELGKSAMKEIGKKALEETKRMAIEKIEKELNEVCNKNLRQNSKKYIEDMINPTEPYRNRKRFQDLKNDLDDVRTTGEGSGALFNKLVSDSNLKGDLGAHYSESYIKNKFGGNISREVVSGNNRLDLMVENSTKNAIVKELKIQNNEVVSQQLPIARDKKMAFEIKNGSINYLKQEIDSGHLLGQIEEGLSKSDYSFVGIPADIFVKLKESEVGKNIVSKINESGGHIITTIPDNLTQIKIAEGMNL